MVRKVFSAAAALVLTASAAQASTLLLDFEPVSQPDFGQVGGSSVIDYGVVAVDDQGNEISASLTALNTFGSYRPNFQGSVAGDARVNLHRGETASLALSLFYTQSGLAYDGGGQDFDWSVVFYDIDGSTANDSYDRVVVRTEGFATVSTDNELYIEQVEDGLLVDARNVEILDVLGQNGLRVLTPEQEPISFGYTVQNISTLLFDYSIVGDANNFSLGYGRNVLVDGGELLSTFEGPTSFVPFQPNVPAVPLPAGAPLMLLGFAALVFVRRRKAS